MLGSPLFGMWVAGVTAAFTFDCFFDWLRSRRPAEARRFCLGMVATVLTTVVAITGGT
jgi:hypothetical protein